MNRFGNEFDTEQTIFADSLLHARKYDTMCEMDVGIAYLWDIWLPWQTRDSIEIHDSNEKFPHFSFRIRVIIGCSESNFVLIFSWSVIAMLDVIEYVYGLNSIETILHSEQCNTIRSSFGKEYLAVREVLYNEWFYMWYKRLKYTKVDTNSLLRYRSL